MAKLSETQIYFRRSIVLIFFAAIVFYTGKSILNGIYSAYLALFPEEVPPPEAKFGVLPTLKMSSASTANTPVYVLNTETGNLPQFPDRMYVYEIEEPRTNLLSEQTIKNLATTLNFGANLVKNGVSKLRWSDGVNNRTFTADIVTKNFQLSTGTEKLTTVVSQALSIRNTDAEEETIQFIKSNNLMSETDSNNIYTVTTPSMIVLSRLRESKVNPQSSKLMKVDVFRNLVEEPGDKRQGIEPIKHKILGPNPKNSLVNFYVTNSNEPFKFPIINFTYWNINYETRSEYPLTPISNIWEIVKNNSGVITYMKTENEDYFESFSNNLNIERIDINDIYLAYYEPMEYQSYLQPIYVFEGTFITVPQSGQLPERGEITIYYPAVRGDYVVVQR